MVYEYDSPVGGTSLAFYCIEAGDPAASINCERSRGPGFVFYIALDILLKNSLIRIAPDPASSAEKIVTFRDRLA